jgi:hypothetical protein
MPRLYVFEGCENFDHAAFTADPEAYLHGRSPQTEGLGLAGAVEEYAEDQYWSEDNDGQEVIVAADDGRAWRVTVRVQTTYRASPRPWSP